MRHKCAVRLLSEDEYKGRGLTLQRLEEDVLHGRYSPRPIHGFLSTPKANGVPRFVPVLHHHDVAVCFGCIKQFDERLAAIAVPDTFGGWTLDSQRQSAEKRRAAEIIGASAPPSSYNVWAWYRHWLQYWKLLARRYEHAPEVSCFATFDVANFYDTIDLARLERRLRHLCPEQALPIEVVVYVLQTWNRALNGYARTTKGIPMDKIGDCSRVLANYYLVEFDQALRDDAERASAHFLRYADDMVLVASSPSQCRELMYRASGHLHRIGLNINVSKVYYKTKSEFDDAWGFDILDGLEAVRDGAGNLEELLQEFRARLGGKTYERWHTALKAMLNPVSGRTDLEKWQDWVLCTALSKSDFLVQLEARHFEHLMVISRHRRRACETLHDIINAVMAEPFTEPKVELLRLLEPYRTNADPELASLANSGIGAIARLGDPVLSLALSNMPEAKTPFRRNAPRRACKTSDDVEITAERSGAAFS
jgi:hypothetical protein